MSILRRYLAFLLLLAGLQGAAHAGQRVALVVGNGSYAVAGQLANPVNDAQLVGQALGRDGFETVSVRNASMAQFRVALSSFREKAQGAEIAVVYFAGHGVEANGRNWLIPVDARLASDFDLQFEAIDLDQVMAALSGAKMRIVVLDACRNNPFGQGWKSGSRAVTRGLGRVETDDVMVIFAAAPGTTASDGSSGNSPFASSLARRLLEPGLAVQLLGGMVRDDVLEATGGAQRPFVSASVTGRPIYLVPGNASSAPAPQPAPALALPTPQLQVGGGTALSIAGAGATDENVTENSLIGDWTIQATSGPAAGATGRFTISRQNSVWSIKGKFGDCSLRNLAVSGTHVSWTCSLLFMSSHDHAELLPSGRLEGQAGTGGGSTSFVASKL